MPAIHLPRLHKQVNDLVPYCSEPIIFLRKLKDLFDFYGNRTLRPSQVAAKPSAIPAAHVPRPVLRQLVSALTPYAQSAPHLIVDLARELWDYGWLEHRLLACQMLGKLPPSQAEGIIELVEAWCLQNHEEELLVAMAERSLAPLQTEQHELLIEKADEWFKHKNIPADQPPLPAAVLLNFQKLGMRALIPLIEDPRYENLPKIYNTLKPILQAPPKVLRPELLNLIKRLGQRSPQETTFFLRGLHAETPSATLTWLIRRSLSSFPDDIQKRLREMINPVKPL
jgi:hypothetical protein